mmetsp:Transcript_135049/g.190983  ORF Transcript_135049/g.190983 Transcript_135049/m.190983 type:complete len:184 (-) Transcript_135049:200-751(-)
MADFDWQGTLQAAVDTGAVEAVLALDTSGNFYGSYPLNEAGEYKNNVWGGEYAYEGTATQEDGSEATVTIDEIDNIVKLVSDRKGEIPSGVGIRIDQVKYQHINIVKGETFTITPDGVEDEQEITMDRIHVLRKGTTGVAIAVRGDYIFIAIHDANKPEQQFPDAAKAVCHVSYWCTGADPEE